MPGAQSTRERMDFLLEFLSKDLLKSKAKSPIGGTGGNVGKLLNIAAEYYVLCLERKDKGLLKYLEKRLEFTPTEDARKDGAEFERLLKRLAKE